MHEVQTVTWNIGEELDIGYSQQPYSRWLNWITNHNTLYYLQFQFHVWQTFLIVKHCIFAVCHFVFKILYIVFVVAKENISSDTMYGNTSYQMQCLAYVRGKFGFFKHCVFAVENGNIVNVTMYSIYWIIWYL